MSVTTRQLVDATRASLTAAEAEERELKSLQRNLERDIAVIDGEVDEALATLATTLLPDLGDAPLQRAASLLRQPQFQPDRARARRAQETAELTASLGRLHADEQWLQRETIENEVAIQRAELTETMEPLQRSVAELEDEPLWSDLLAARYGTAEYTVPWWHLDYYRHWKHGDLIVEKYGPRYKLADFGAVVARYLDEKKALGEFERSLARVEARGAAVKKVVEEIARTTELLGSVDERFLGRTRGAVRDFVRPLADADLLGLFAKDADLALCAKRVLGLRAKQQYLRRMVDEDVVPSIGAVTEMRGKFERDVAKLSRPKNAGRTFSHAELTRRQPGDRPAKWRKRRERWSTMRTQIVSFHHYDRFDPVADILWWDLMTDGELDGDFVPEVRARGMHDHHHHHHHRGGGIDHVDVS
jgi:hypothetical protein